MLWFNGGAREITKEPITKSSDENVILYVNTFEHRTVVELDRPNRHQPYPQPRLTELAKDWVDTNCPGYIAKPSSLANIMIEITFRNKIDATLFKLFWL